MVARALRLSLRVLPLPRLLMALFRLWMTAALVAQALTRAAALTRVQALAAVVQAPVVAQAPEVAVATTSSQLGTD